MKIKKSDYTHYGYITGIPCYIRSIDSEAPEVVGRNLLFDFIINYITTPITYGVDALLTLICYDYEPLFRIKITGEIKKGELN